MPCLNSKIGHAHAHTRAHTQCASLFICFPSIPKGKRIPYRWDESNGIILKHILPPLLQGIEEDYMQLS